MSNVTTRLHALFSSTRNAVNSVKSNPSIKYPNPTKTTPCVSDQSIHQGMKDLLEEKDSKKLVGKFKTLSTNSFFRGRYKLYDFTIHRLALTKQFSLIEDALESQKKYICGEGFAARIIMLYGKAGMFEHALKVFDELPQRGIQQGFKSFNALLVAASKADKFDKVIELFRELPSKLCIQPNVGCYNIAANALCKLGLLDDAVSLLDEMEEKGLKPCVVSMNTLLGAFYKKGRFEEGDKIWERMIQSGMNPDIVSYDMKLLRLINDGKFSEAMELLKEFKSKGLKPNVGTYNALILGCCKNDDLEGVKKWYSRLWNTCGVPNNGTFNIIVPFLCDKGDYGFALEVCRRMFKGNCSVDESVLQKVVDGLAKNSMMKEADILVGLARSNGFFPCNLILPKKC